MFRPAQQFQASVLVGRIRVSVIDAQVETICDRERGEDLHSFCCRAADIFQRSKCRIRQDEIRDLIVEVGHAKMNAILPERLFETRNRSLHSLLA